MHKDSEKLQELGILYTEEMQTNGEKQRVEEKQMDEEIDRSEGNKQGMETQNDEEMD